jgi:tRNA(Arg) A34 adenosine deaminase TadA
VTCTLEDFSIEREFHNFFFLGYEVITMVIVSVITKEKSLGTAYDQENWMLVVHGGNNIQSNCNNSLAKLHKIQHCTANVCRDLQGLYREIGERGFQIYEDCMFTCNPCNFCSKYFVWTFDI